MCFVLFVDSFLNNLITFGVTGREGGEATLRPLKAPLWPLKAPSPGLHPGLGFFSACSWGAREIPTPCKFCCAVGFCWVLFSFATKLRKKKNTE